MIDPRGRDLLGRGIAGVLRSGTLIAIVAIGVGYFLLLASGEAPGSPPLLELLGGGGAPALIGLGLLGLTLLPAAVLGVAVAGFRRLREHRLVLITTAVLVLLLASLATAIMLALG